MISTKFTQEAGFLFGFLPDSNVLLLKGSRSSMISVRVRSRFFLGSQTHSIFKPKPAEPGERAPRYFVQVKAHPAHGRSYSSMGGCQLMNHHELNRGSGPRDSLFRTRCTLLTDEASRRWENAIQLTNYHELNRGSESRDSLYRWRVRLPKSPTEFEIEA